MTHIVCVDAYEGAFEPFAEAGSSRPAGLGLPWPELATVLDAHITLLSWSAWYDYELRGDSPVSWMRFPATRPVTKHTPARTRPPSDAGRIRQRPLALLDPDRDRALDVGALSKRVLGMLAERDLLFFLSMLLHRNLLALHAEDPIDLLVVPMWGGLGFIAQLEAHAGDEPLASTPIAVVVTSTSRSRYAANQEGNWSRPSIVRHQREELSLALADVALVFGDRGLRVAQSGRLRTSRQAVLAPFAVDAEAAVHLGGAGRAGGNTMPLRFSLAGPCEGASGALALLEAVRIMPRPAAPVTCAGEDRVFAPMAPRSFRDYWSSRGWVRELMDEGAWTWTTPPASPSTTEVRLHIGPFAHLIDPLPDLAAGKLALFGPAAADTLPAGIPEALLLGAEPDAGLLASRLTTLAALPADEIERLRLAAGTAFIEARVGGDWESRLQNTADSFRTAMRAPRSVSIAEAFRRQLDPRRPLVEWTDTPGVTAAVEPTTLTVVVPCFESGALVEETVASIWKSSRLPDEVIIVDDGSRDVATREALSRLAKHADTAGLPLRVLRQRNRGLAGARNAGLSAATGTFISFLDGDDLIDPSFYQVALALLAREPGLGGVAAWADVIGDDVAFWNAPQPELPLLLVENLVIVPLVTRTALLRALGGYDERQRYNYEDWELSIRFLSRGHPIVTLPRYLQKYRVRGDSLFRTMTAVQHQVMRELTFETHAATFQSFATEVALQLEHRLAEFRFADARSARSPVLAAVASSSTLGGAARRARNVLVRAAARLRRLTGS